MALQARQAEETETPDNLSLVTIAGPLIAHTTPEAWLASFTAFQPEFRATTPNIQSLALSLDAALAATPQGGMKRAILFITPHMEDPQLEAALSTIGKRAVESRTRISIWLVDGEQFFSHPSALLFQSLAAQTGGGYMAFSGREAPPDPETYFASLRNVYRLTYTSALATSGEHTLSVDVSLAGASISSAPQAFTLNVQPPNPIFVGAACAVDPLRAVATIPIMPICSCPSNNCLRSSLIFLMVTLAPSPAARSLWMVNLQRRTTPLHSNALSGTCAAIP